jgi:SGNH hydrolase-like domain, acetyltransferase AlgX
MQAEQAERTARHLWLTVGSTLPALLALACAGGGASAPWPRPEAPRRLAHAEVSTLNPDYQRQKSAVLVRKIDRPTRANLDFAAYHANFMIAEPPPEDQRQTGGVPKYDPANVFRGLIAGDSLTGSIAATPLTKEERARPLAAAPLAQWLSERDAKLAGGLEDLLSAVREENWGLGAGPPLPRQQATELFLHQPAGKPAELWVRIEFAPWFHGFSDLPDEDEDGSPEIYGRAKPGVLDDQALALVRDDYAGKVLAANEVHSWAHKLASYWYPSYNTDLATSGPSWPDDQTEGPVKSELGVLKLEAPTVVMRGKPQGQPTYNVFVVAGIAPKDGGGNTVKTAGGHKLGKSKPSADPAPVIKGIEGELAAAGGSWERWQKQVAPFQAAVRKKLKSAPPAIKALPGQDGFLFYRASLDYVVGGDLEKQPRKKNPVPVIKQWKTFLAGQGVDFLFVPVPTKAEIFPDKLDPAGASLKGKVVNPQARKLLHSLSKAGVEVVDLWTPFLKARSEAGESELFQRQDTHWTSRGLELAASVIAERIARYPWAKQLPRQKLTTRPANFARHGDLVSRLRESDRKGLKPEALVGQQVLTAHGKPYDDDPESPVVVLGDSFTGVYQLTDCEHAGLSAHLARALGHPVDLVMSYGGGPNVRHKLMRRGAADIASKRLVIWVMTARDLYNYWEDWEPLNAAEVGGRQAKR